MENSIGKWFVDILNCINEIDSFFENQELKFEDYSKNIMLKRAIERNLEIIGEAVNRVLRKSPEIEISNARQIVQFRNLVIHSYDNISDANVWAIIINHLPKLKTEVQELLQKHFPNFPIVP